MALPYERSFTAIDGTSTIDEGFLNEELQDSVVRTDSAQRRRGFVMADDFLAATLSDMWTSLTNCTVGTDDKDDEGFGTAHIVYAGTDVGGIRGTLRLPLTAPFVFDWAFYARVRVLSWTGASCELGLTPAGGSHWVGFKATTADPTWSVSADWNLGATSDTGDGTGIILPYTDLEMRFNSTSGLLSYYINGALVESETASFGATTLSLHYYSSGSAANIHLDKISLWVDR